MSRNQELKIVNAEKYFIPLADAPYKNDLFTCKILIAIKNKIIICFVAFHPHELAYLYVDPPSQKQGIGKALSKKALLLMTPPITLNVFAENYQAKKLYSKLGFISHQIEYSIWDPTDANLYYNETMILK